MIKHINKLHYALWLLGRDQEQKLKEHIAAYGNDEMFWRVAEGLADILPDGDDEKRILLKLIEARERLV